MTYAELIGAAQSTQFWVGFIPATVAAAAGWLNLFRNFSRLRFIADTPSSLIRSASQGYVELQGVARMMDGEPIMSPLTGRRCVWYRYTIEEKTGEDRKEWRVIERGLSEAIFHLDDHTGRCIVDPDGADVIPSSNERWRGHSRRPGGLPRDQGFWDRLARSGPYRYTESLIEEGAPLYVIGFMRGLASADPGTTNDAIRQLIRRWKQNPADLLRRFDADRDGVISPAEWDVALQMAEHEALMNWHRTASDAELNLLRKPADGRPFLLSTVPELVLKRRYRNQAWWSAGAFLLFATVAAWILYLRYFPPEG